MSVEEILQRLMADLRETMEPFEQSDYHMVCRGACETCSYLDRVREDVDAAERALERLRLGITRAA